MDFYSRSIPIPPRLEPTPTESEKKTRRFTATEYILLYVGKLSNISTYMAVGSDARETSI